jgi:hypothetical protein
MTAITHTISTTWSASNDASIPASLAQSGDGADSRSLTIADATDGQEIDISWTNANLKSLFILASRAMTIFSNVDGGAGNDTLVLTANIPKVYQASGGQVNPFITANVTKLYVDNLSGGSGTLEIRVLVDSTP